MYGTPATDEAIETMRKRGIDLSSHRSRAVEAAELQTADLIVGMTSIHRREILAMAPDAGRRFVLLKELLELALDGELPPGAEARLERLLGAPRPEWRRALDLDDPIGKPIGAYEKTAAEIQMAIEVLVDALCDGKPTT
jgi:protein-tyrosine-phosphatase